MTRTRIVSRFVRALFANAWQSVITWVVVLTAIGAVIALVASQFATIDALRTRNFQLGQNTSEAAARYDRLFDEYSKLYDESEQQGVKPSTTNPDDVPTKATSGPTGATGAAGQDGSDGDDGTPGADGRDGRDGKDGAQGAPGATGATGATGAAGETGAAGTAGTDGATGPQGPQGPTGATGANGTDGKDGRGVASIDCVATDAGTVFRFTYTDGTTADVPGSCTPAPTDTPTG